MSPYLLSVPVAQTEREKGGKREREQERILPLLLHIWLTDKQSLGYTLVSRRGGGQLCVDGTALVTPKPWRLSPDIKQKKHSERSMHARARARTHARTHICSGGLSDSQLPRLCSACCSSLWLSRTTTIGLFRNRGLVPSRWGHPSPQRGKTICSCHDKELLV